MKLIAALLLFGASVLLWASDRITLKGERTIYTVQCPDGHWEETLCTDKLVDGDRYRFRASKSRQEVLFWIVSSSKPSGKFTDCRVTDRDNWMCNGGEGQPPTIAHGLVNGRPVDAGPGRDLPFQAVHKWKWWVLHAGARVFADADY